MLAGDCNPNSRYWVDLIGRDRLDLGLATLVTEPSSGGGLLRPTFFGLIGSEPDAWFLPFRLDLRCSASVITSAARPISTFDP